MTDEVQQDNPRHWRRAVEALDACRPGRDDHLHPELAWLVEQLAADRQLRQLYDRRQRFDAAVAEAFQSVDIPWGLHERLLARLEAATATAESDASVAAAVVSEAVANEPATLALPSHRRRWFTMAAAACVAVAAGGLGLLAWLGQPSGKFTAEDVLTEALALHRSLAEQADLELAAQPRRQQWMSRWVAAPPEVVGLRLPDHPLLGSGVRYDLPGHPGVAAWLYVLPLKGHRPGSIALPSSPDRSVLSTGGFALTTWQEDNFMLVLVVEGGRGDLRSLLQQRGPVA